MEVDLKKVIGQKLSYIFFNSCKTGTKFSKSCKYLLRLHFRAILSNLQTCTANLIQKCTPRSRLAYMRKKEFLKDNSEEVI